MTDTIILAPRAAAIVVLSNIILPPAFVITTDAGDPVISDNGGTIIPDRGSVTTDAEGQSISDDGRDLTTDS